MQPRDIEAYCTECATPLFGNDTLPRVMLRMPDGSGRGYVYCDNCLWSLQRELTDQARLTKISVDAGKIDG